ncbi:hypothetical protein B0T17DRAFT_546135 [Bombardia bombarda]|uniref:Uncharacterized protein n=1 Tax=Bombardia bombarda TaxID=252184 RepID=A0AA39U189_9PEZI|nr:hypothetical protein B0T17DRAFT_546135 [Bombardia bombarda]
MCNQAILTYECGCKSASDFLQCNNMWIINPEARCDHPIEDRYKIRNKCYYHLTKISEISRKTAEAEAKDKAKDKAKDHHHRRDRQDRQHHQRSYGSSRC